MFISFLRTIVLYVVIVITVRLMGKRQIGELEPSELVVAILISDLASVPMQDIGIPLLGGVIPIVTLLALELLSSECSLRSLRFRAFLCGKPVLLIADGTIDQRAMRRNRITMDELEECLRGAGALDVAKVKFAILETNGQVSVFLFPKYDPLTAQDAGTKPEPLELPVTVVSDGRILGDNLSVLGKDRGWLRETLQQAQVALEEVFLLTADRGGKTNLVRKERST